MSFLLFFCSCSKRQQAINLIPEEQFVNIYADLLIANEEGILLQLDSVSIRQKADSIYHHYNIDTSIVRITLESYKQDMNKWKEFHEKLTNRLANIQREELSPPK
jgi:hypothetical protein